MRSKVVFVGTPDIGVTTFLFRINYGHFPDEYTPSKMDVISRYVNLENHTYELQLWDLDKIEDFIGIRKVAYQETDVFVLCYSIENEQSMIDLNLKWRDEVQKTCPKAKIIVLGLRNNQINSEIPPEVNSFITNHGFIHFFADSQTGVGIEEFLNGLSLVCASSSRADESEKKHSLCRI